MSAPPESAIRERFDVVVVAGEVTYSGEADLDLLIEPRLPFEHIDAHSRGKVKSVKLCFGIHCCVKGEPQWLARRHERLGPGAEFGKLSQSCARSAHETSSTRDEPCPEQGYSQGRQRENDQ